MIETIVCSAIALLWVWIIYVSIKRPRCPKCGAKMEECLFDIEDTAFHPFGVNGFQCPDCHSRWVYL